MDEHNHPCGAVIIAVPIKCPLALVPHLYWNTDGAAMDGETILAHKIGPYRSCKEVDKKNPSIL